MPEPGAVATQTPNYAELVKFLVQPFLELPESLRVDCEVSHSRAKVWVRLAFEGSDKGRVFGRGGRNIQAIRTVLEAAAQAAGYTAHLDIYGATSHSRDGDIALDASEKPPSRRPVNKSAPRPRSHSES
jgi:predicted RNA-binding protein YlqC (UPF0109 family)